MHNIEYAELEVAKGEAGKKNITARIDSHVEYETRGEGGSGLVNGIRWIDRLCDSYDEAMEFLRANDRGWYDNLAVKYKRYEKAAKKSQRILNLERRLKEAYARLQELHSNTYFADFKSAFIGCKKCNSKINKDFMKTRFKCPVCGFDMRSDTIKKREHDAAEKYTKLQNELELASRSSKYKEYWLIKYEYHT